MRLRSRYSRPALGTFKHVSTSELTAKPDWRAAISSRRMRKKVGDRLGHSPLTRARELSSLQDFAFCVTVFGCVCMFA